MPADEMTRGLGENHLARPQPFQFPIPPKIQIDRNITSAKLGQKLRTSDDGIQLAPIVITRRLVFMNDVEIDGRIASGFRPEHGRRRKTFAFRRVEERRNLEHLM